MTQYLNGKLRACEDTGNILKQHLLRHNHRQPSPLLRMRSCESLSAPFAPIHTHTPLSLFPSRSNTQTHTPPAPLSLPASLRLPRRMYLGYAHNMAAKSKCLGDICDGRLRWKHL